MKWNQANIDKANAAHQQRDEILMAMPEKEFKALHAEWTQKASRKNADTIWIMAKAQADRVAFLRKGGTIEEYRQIVLKRMEARRVARAAARKAVK